MCSSLVAVADDTLVTYTATGTTAPLPFVEYLPPGYSTSTTPERLVVFFHGMGESGGGTDPTEIATALTAHGPLRIIRLAGTGPHRFQNAQRAIVLAPRNPSGLWNGALASQFFGWALQHYRIDRDHVYLTGLSAGGGPTWAIQKDYPGVVAAVVPICPVQQIWPVTAADAIDYRHIAVWAFHGYGDPMVPKDESVRWVDAIAQALSRNAQYPTVLTGFTSGTDQTAIWGPSGFTWAPGIGSSAASPLRYTLLAQNTHFIWQGIYDSNDTWAWLFAQSRSQNVDPGLDGGTPFDAGAAPDAGTADAGTTVDAGAPVDAGVAVDAGVTVDAGTPVDGGSADAGQAPDAGDAGAPVNADAGIDESDAGTVDSGSEAPGIVIGNCSTSGSLPVTLIALLALATRRRRSA